MKLNKKIENKAKKIKIIAMDVDGVLTSGEIIVFDSGGEIKFWNVKDRFAFHLVHRCKKGIKFVWITGRNSKQVEDRAKEIGVDVLHQNCMKKKDALQNIAKELNINSEEILYIGDDLVDIPAFRYVGFSVCPKDAPIEVKNEVDYVSKICGGKGVLREVVEIVLKSQGIWSLATRDYI